jgi:hypothetical protein
LLDNGAKEARCLRGEASFSCYRLFYISLLSWVVVGAASGFGA